MVSRSSPTAQQVDGILNNQVVKFTVVNGANINTDIMVSGITTPDKIVSVVKLDFTLSEGTPNTRTWQAADLSGEASITSAGNIQMGTTDTTGEVLLVLWLDLSE